MSNSLQPHWLQRASLLCPSLSPRVCSNSYPLSWWCFLTISSSAALFSFASIWVFSNESALHIKWPKNWSFSFSISSSDIQGWFPLGLTGLISLLSMGLSTVFSSTTIWKHQFSGAKPSLWSNSHMYMTTGKTIALTIQTFVGKVMFAF